MQGKKRDIARSGYFRTNAEKAGQEAEKAPKQRERELRAVKRREECRRIAFCSEIADGAEKDALDGKKADWGEKEHSKAKLSNRSTRRKNERRARLPRSFSRILERSFG